GTATELPLREQVTNALVNKGVGLGQLGRSEEAITVYDDVVARFGTATELPLRELVANAVVSAVEGTPQIDASQDAEFQSDTAPAADGSLGAARVSVFQKDSVALRLRWPITWTLRTPSALAWMTGVNW